jgi:hypothetical protein
MKVHLVSHFVASLLPVVGSYSNIVKDKGTML